MRSDTVFDTTIVKKISKKELIEVTIHTCCDSDIHQELIDVVSEYLGKVEIQ